MSCEAHGDRIKLKAIVSSIISMDHSFYVNILSCIAMCAKSMVIVFRHECSPVVKIEHRTTSLSAVFHVP